MDQPNFNILQILSGYLCEDTLVHIYEMTNDRYYLKLAEKKTSGRIYSILSIKSGTINGLQYKIKGPCIKVIDTHGNKVKFIAINALLYPVQVHLSNIYMYPALIETFKNTFKELIKGEIQITTDIKKMVVLELDCYQKMYISSNKFSLYDCGTFIDI